LALYEVTRSACKSAFGRLPTLGHYRILRVLGSKNEGRRDHAPIVLRTLLSRWCSACGFPCRGRHWSAQTIDRTDRNNGHRGKGPVNGAFSGERGAIGTASYYRPQETPASKRLSDAAGTAGAPSPVVYRPAARGREGHTAMTRSFYHASPTSPLSTPGPPRPQVTPPGVSAQPIHRSAQKERSQKST
jgi:hypothetical protein